MQQFSPTDTRVVILGGGFAGLYAALELASANCRVTLVDRQNHHTFQPLLYQVATAVLNPSEIAAPFRSVFEKHPNLEFFLGEAISIDREQRLVQLRDGELPYDYLVVATGMTNTFYGNDHWREHVLPLKTVADALHLRGRILATFERAEREKDPARRRELLRFVVIGAGPTGVEMAGAIREISGKVMERAFRNIQPHEAEVILLDAAPRILPTFPEDLAAYAHETLEGLGVTIHTDCMVKDIREGVVVAGDHTFETDTAIWAAGLKPTEIVRTLACETHGKSGQVMVTPKLHLPDDPHVFAIGDIASLEQDGQPLPGLAPVAIQQGEYVGKAIKARLTGDAIEPFRYRERGNMATIGRSTAIADIFGRHLTGRFAWVLWLVVHLVWLIGFRSRAIVLIQWSYAYIAWKRSAQLIIGLPLPPLPDPEVTNTAVSTTAPVNGSRDER